MREGGKYGSVQGRTSYGESGDYGIPVKASGISLVGGGRGGTIH